MINGWGISFEIALIWMSLDSTDGQSKLVQVMAWCRQAASHYLVQRWTRSLLPYGVTRPELVKLKHATNSNIAMITFRLSWMGVPLPHSSAYNRPHSIYCRLYLYNGTFILSYTEPIDPDKLNRWNQCDHYETIKNVYRLPNLWMLM